MTKQQCLESISNMHFTDCLPGVIDAQSFAIESAYKRAISRVLNQLPDDAVLTPEEFTTLVNLVIDKMAEIFTS